jgi:hypothetical protein
VPHLRIAVVTVAGAVMLAAGCGGDDSNTLAKAELAKKADAICAKYNAKQKALKDPTDTKGFITYLEQLAPIADGQFKELSALKPADAIKSEWKAILEDYDKLRATAGEAKTALEKNDQKTFAKVAASADGLSKKTDKKLDAFGAPRCGSKSNA